GYAVIAGAGGASAATVAAFDGRAALKGGADAGGSVRRKEIKAAAGAATRARAGTVDHQRAHRRGNAGGDAHAGPRGCRTAGVGEAAFSRVSEGRASGADEQKSSNQSFHASLFDI